MLRLPAVGVSTSVRFVPAVTVAPEATSRTISAYAICVVEVEEAESVKAEETAICFATSPDGESSTVASEDVETFIAVPETAVSSVYTIVQPGGTVSVVLVEIEVPFGSDIMPVVEAFFSQLGNGNVHGVLCMIIFSKLVHPSNQLFAPYPSPLFGDIYKSAVLSDVHPLQ